MDISQQIKNIDLFQGVSSERMARIVSEAVFRKYPAQSMVIGETDPIKSFYVVLSGRLKLSKSSPEGKEQTVQLLGPGEPFGLCTAFATDAFPASAMAIEESVVMLIPGPLMEAVAMSEPQLLINIITILSRRLRNSMDLIESLALKELPGRIASFLLHELSRNGSDHQRLDLNISQRELAKILGATPEALSRALRKMSSDGVIDVSGRTIRILEYPMLVELAAGE